jgi:hypothetical protein
MQRERQEPGDAKQGRLRGQERDHLWSAPIPVPRMPSRQPFGMAWLSESNLPHGRSGKPHNSPIDGLGSDTRV